MAHLSIAETPPNVMYKAEAGVSCISKHVVHVHVLGSPHSDGVYLRAKVHRLVRAVFFNEHAQAPKSIAQRMAVIFRRFVPKGIELGLVLDRKEFVVVLFGSTLHPPVGSNAFSGSGAFRFLRPRKLKPASSSGTGVLPVDMF